MKAFFTALFAAVASAHDHVSQVVDLGSSPAEGALGVLGEISLAIGLSKDGSGPDATVSPVFAVSCESNSAQSLPAWRSVASIFRMAFAATETSEQSELSSIEMSQQGSNLVMTYTYGNWDVTPTAGLAADLSTGNAGTYSFIVDEATGYKAVTGAVAPGVGYWQLDQGLFTLEDTHVQGESSEVWEFGLIRSNPGVAGIAAGATAYGQIAYLADGQLYYLGGGDLTWPVAETS